MRQGKTLFTFLTASLIAGCSGNVNNDEARAVITTLVTISYDGKPLTGGISAYAVTSDNGRYVAFHSDADNLLPGVTPSGADTHVYLRDTWEKTTSLVSVNTGGNPAEGSSAYPSISGNGQYVAFRSNATDLVDGDTEGHADIFVRDMWGGITERVSLDSAGVAANSYNENPSISQDGKYVAFSSAATNLIGTGNDNNSREDIFVRDLNGMTTERVSIDSDEAEVTGGHSQFPSISGDGRYVAFASFSDDFDTNDNNGISDVFVRDRTLGTTTTASVKPNGDTDLAPSTHPQISQDGQWVVFSSTADDLLVSNEDNNGKQDIFLRNWTSTSPATIRVSVTTAGTEVNFGSSSPSISGDGRYIVFESDQLSDTDRTFSMTDIYSHDRLTGETLLISLSSGGFSQANDACFTSKISADALTIVFMTAATNLDQNHTGDTIDVFKVGPN